MQNFINFVLYNKAMENRTISQLAEENMELKRAIALLMNKSLIKKISEALRRINSGEYVSEEEFFKNSPQ